VSPGVHLSSSTQSYLNQGLAGNMLPRLRSGRRTPTPTATLTGSTVDRHSSDHPASTLAAYGWLGETNGISTSVLPRSYTPFPTDVGCGLRLLDCRTRINCFVGVGLELPHKLSGCLRQEIRLLQEGIGKRVQYCRTLVVAQSGAGAVSGVLTHALGALGIS
jgi:hypothetical protein